MKKITLLFCLCSMASFAQSIGLTTFATGLSNPTEMAHANDDRMFVVQKSGAIKIVNPDGSINATNFLTLSNNVINFSGNERGLLGLAFHPDYETNGFFYVNYTRAGDGATVVARYSVSSGNANVADPLSGEVIITVAQPFENHNGGSIKFGPDGYLYIGMGDGGSANDPGNRAQNINENLGKMLRIDVDGDLPYEIPADNPFVGTDGNDEIWATGLRNPWKFSFDSNTGDLWIADVGQNAVEEINRVSSTAAGVNYGWKCYEGNNVFTAGCANAGTTYTFPIAQYLHSSGGCSVTGGYVYNGTTYPNFVGKYFFSDYCFDKIGMSDSDGDFVYSQSFSNLSGITSFGEDSSGELYVVSSDTGTIFRIVDTSLSTANNLKGALSIYPNPATSEVFIQNASDNLLAKATIYDLSGKKLAEESLANSSINTLNTSMFQTGIYLISVEDATGDTYTSQLIIR